MASWLRLVTFNSVPRSLVPFRPTVVSFASRFLSIEAGHRIYTTMPNDVSDFYDQAWVKNMCPKLSSLSIYMEMENDSYTGISLGIPNEGFIGLNAPVLEKWDTRACVEHNTLLIQGKTLKEMKDGMLKTTLPYEDDFKTSIMSNITADIIASFITATRGWRYYDMFYDRSILGEVFCPAIAMLSPINSFSIYKKETDHKLSIRIEMPGDEKMRLTTQGLRVSLNLRRTYRLVDDNDLREPEIEDVKTFFDYDTFFVEEKMKNEHYITGIHLPAGINKKHNLIKRRLKDRVFHAFFPYVKKQEIKIN